MRITSAILSIMATATLAVAGDWGFTGYTGEDCTGDGVVGFGDQVAYGCTNLGTSATIMSVGGDVDGFEILIYSEDNCGGNYMLTIRDSGTCSTAGRGDFPQIRSFEVVGVLPTRDDVLGGWGYADYVSGK